MGILSTIFSWTTLYYVLLVLYVPACVGLIVIVLLQKGKGAGFGGAFGVGPGSDAVFGPRSNRSLPQRLTTILAAVFMGFALVMSLIAGNVYQGVAPEMVEEESSLGTAAKDLEALGLGSGLPGDAAPPSTPIEIQQPSGDTPAPAPEAAAPAPTGDAVAVPPAVETPAPATESPTPESTPAPATGN